MHFQTRDNEVACGVSASREREMVERSRALIVQIDEEINRMERELAHVSSSWFVGLP